MTSFTMYVKFVAYYEVKFVSSLRVIDSIQRPLKLYCDNEQTILYAHNNKKTKAAKHMNIRFYIVKVKIQNQTISLEHISIKKMSVNPLTKGLLPSVFREHLADMSLRERL
jgi:hypothetical protein